MQMGALSLVTLDPQWNPLWLIQVYVPGSSKRKNNSSHLLNTFSALPHLTWDWRWLSTDWHGDFLGVIHSLKPSFCAAFFPFSTPHEMLCAVIVNVTTPPQKSLSVLRTFVCFMNWTTPRGHPLVYTGCSTSCLVVSGLSLSRGGSFPGPKPRRVPEILLDHLPLASLELWGLLGTGNGKCEISVGCSFLWGFKLKRGFPPCDSVLMGWSEVGFEKYTV